MLGETFTFIKALTESSKRYAAPNSNFSLNNTFAETSKETAEPATTLVINAGFNLKASDKLKT